MQDDSTPRSTVSDLNQGKKKTFTAIIDQRRLKDLAYLYASKSGAIVVGLLILPLFSRQLGTELFGIVALIFTIQAFLLLLDFGMSTVVSRELAAADATSSQRYVTWRAAERLISLVYAFLTIPVMLTFWILGGPLRLVEVIGCLVLFWALTLQNIGQSALLARHQFIEAALIQIAGVLVRHGLAALALAWIAPTVSWFILAQGSVSVAQMLVTRWRCLTILRPTTAKLNRRSLRERTYTLLRTGGPLMIFGLSGAAVMQLDKVIVSGLISPRDLAPYFLATTFCLLPISVLAAPVAQFFQPRIIRAISSAEEEMIRDTVSQFNYYIAIFALFPTVVIWLFHAPLIAMWLRNSDDVTLVVKYSAVLLPGIGLGALGYVPYTILVSQQDYKFQARFSLVLTAVTLGTVIIAAVRGSIFAVCIIYALYHSTSTIGSWLRCIQLGAGGGVAAAGARQAALLALLAIAGAASLAAISAKF